ncbi:MAG: hypothetical protein H7255_03340 [Ramlibacter sp.]|nr:hypothetical protein [Ramlibacter sp.]
MDRLGSKAAHKALARPHEGLRRQSEQAPEATVSQDTPGLPETLELESCQDTYLALVSSIRDPHVQVDLAGRILQRIGECEPTSRLMQTALKLADILIQNCVDREPGFDQGKLLLRATEPGTLFDKNQLFAVSDLVAAFSHPGIPQDVKTAAAAQVVAALAGCNADNSLDACAVALAASPSMNRSKRAAAAVCLWRINFALGRVDASLTTRISAVAELVAGIEDDEECVALQKLLRDLCVEHSSAGLLECFAAPLIAERIRLGAPDAPQLLVQLLRESYRRHPAWTASECNLIAIATFQVDPDGTAFVPCSEVVDSATKFAYPEWLTQRRAELHDFSGRSQRQVTEAILQAIPGIIRPLAQISQDYVGIPVHAFDWPALREHLQSKFPRAG